MNWMQYATRRSSSTIKDRAMTDDDTIFNTSGNRPFDAVLEVNLTRRKVLGGGLAAAVAGFLTHPALATVAAAAPSADTGALLGFKPVPLAKGKGAWPLISEDYDFQVLIPWGTPIVPSGPAWNWPPSAADQARQVGIGHDGMWFFPFDNDPNRHGMLALNHEYCSNRHLLGRKSPRSLDDVRTSQHAHGVSVVEMAFTDGAWHTVESTKARRIHANTPVAFSGPAADHALLATPSGNPPLGTLSNCSCGHTPWGTYLTCEENINWHFGALKDGRPSKAQRRYGFSADGNGYDWHRFDPRFDLSNRDFRHEENRFGWVVEIDPFDASQTPVKRTALGRFKHEGAAIVVGRDKRVVAYMGDDQRFDYIYKFVSAGDWEAMRGAGKSPLDEGTLYAARFNDDGSGEWLPLSLDNPKLADRFADLGGIVTFARLAADAAGATPMDRPEWTTVAPDGQVYCSLTNNSRRETADAANPMAPNRSGHIIRWRDADEHVGLRFTWDIFLIAEETHGSEHSFSDPDGLWADPDGRLFIATDGNQEDGLNNQLLVADTSTGEIRRLLTGVPRDEITGITVTPDRRTLFVNIQHPGNGNPKRTNFPARRDGVTVPRDATLAIRRKDGGIVGS